MNVNKILSNLQKILKEIQLCVMIPLKKSGVKEMPTIYERIKQRRQELGLTVEELATRMGYKDKSSISKIENGKADIPTSKVMAFARALDTTTAYLLGMDDAGQIPPGFDPPPRTVKRPLVGNIACGEPITAEENIEEYVDVPENIRCDFCLRCKGDSMIGAGIHDGDIVYIRKQSMVDTGQIAAVRIGTEATLKRLYIHSDYLELRPENAAYKSIICRRDTTDEVTIEGLAVGFTHWFI